jgi:Beta-lactamase
MSRLRQAIEGDVERKLYDGAVAIVGVDGKVAFEEAIGFADRHAGASTQRDSVFPSSPSRRPSTPSSCCSAWTVARHA